MSEKVCLLCFSFAKLTKDIRLTRLQSVYEGLTDIKTRVTPLVQLGVFNADHLSLPNDYVEIEVQPAVPVLNKEYIKQELMENASGSYEIKVEIKEEHIKNEYLRSPDSKDKTAKVEQITTEAYEKPYSCDDCGRRFFHLCHLRVHKRIHSGVKPFSCDVCNKNFAQICNLKTHRLTHDGVKIFCCDVCDKKFARLNSLKRHKALHTGEQPYSCDICGRKFSHSSSLRTHKLTHSNEKSYTCDVCGEKFTHLTMMKRHKVLHSDENPYVCHFCNEKCPHVKALKLHLRTHRGKQFICDICYKQFSSRANLTQHKKIHTDDNPYTCDICGKAFSRRDHLRRHRLTHDKYLELVKQESDQQQQYQQ
ncbi:zinc finger protein 492-like isoform X2 [Aricia agestis]|uniref:zinc finger protein 492-like isoform X2 n=1 Tax=Aricia agestis TaxID=91739 RepID=UPI001C2015DA|nr:zinc finger protein 492-like isoform X2 [Aricia agestis]